VEERVGGEEGISLSLPVEERAGERRPL